MENTEIFKKNQQVRLLVLAFTIIYSIFLRLFVLIACGRFPVWPVFEGGQNNTKHDRLEVFSIFYSLANDVLSVCMGFANMSREVLSSVSFQKNGPRTLHFFYTCPVLLSNASRIYTFSRLGDAKFPKTYRWLHDNKVMNLLSDLFSQLVKLQWLYI